MTEKQRDSRAERFRAIYEANARRVLAFALRRVRQPQDAADIVADTFLIAWRRIDEVPDGTAARLWLFGVARRVLANARRSSERRDRLGEKLVEYRQAITTSLPDLHTEHVVRQALDRLDDEDRELLILTNWEGLRPSEVAIVMGLPVGTVRSQLHRARRRLRAQLEREDEDRAAQRGDL